MGTALGGPPPGSLGRVLVVDDDPAIRQMLQRVLRVEGFSVETASDGASTYAAVRSYRPDVVLLDVALAGEDGFEILAELRTRHQVPVLFVTGRASEPDRVLGLRIGADDYIVKPFSYTELVARVQAVLRRSRPKSVDAQRKFGPLLLDLGSREAYLGDRRIDLTATEYELLVFLSESPRQVFSRNQLLERVWGSSDAWQSSATVTEYVRRLRSKLEAGDDWEWIATVRGVGYRFEPPQDPPE